MAKTTTDFDQEKFWENLFKSNGNRIDQAVLGGKVPSL